MDRPAATADGVCMECTGDTPDLNPARTACGVHDDSDGIFNADDNCPNVDNADQTNTDDDGLGNACDADDDNDGTADASDNCPIVANADQANADDDELGNACDADDDDDGVADADDAFPTDECASLDTDDDNMPDRLVEGCTTSLTADTDDDDDGTADATDVDDDNDGLIEIATAAELDNIRHDLAGASYDDGGR